MNCTSLYREQFFAYVAEDDPLYVKEFIRPADLSGEYLWLLDEDIVFATNL